MSKRMNATSAALMILRIRDATKGASEEALTVVRDDLTRQIEELAEKRQKKREGQVIT